MQVIQESLADLQAATAANVLGSGVLSSLQLGPDFSMRLPSLNLCNQNSCSSTPPGTQPAPPIKQTNKGADCKEDETRYSTNTASSGGVAENAASVANGAHGESAAAQEATLAAVSALSAAAADAAAGADSSAKRSSGNGSLKSGGTILDPAVEPAPTNMSDDTVAVC
jgi:hypothetical protein